MHSVPKLPWSLTGKHSVATAHVHIWQIFDISQLKQESESYDTKQFADRLDSKVQSRMQGLWEELSCCWVETAHVGTCTNRRGDVDSPPSAPIPERWTVTEVIAAACMWLNFKARLSRPNNVLLGPVGPTNSHQSAYAAIYPSSSHKIETDKQSVNQKLISLAAWKLWGG